MKKIERALISVTDKTGIIEFSGGLHELGIHIISTGGTAKILKDAGIPITLISEFTGFPEILDGRVKTLHPKVHGGLLGLRSKQSHIDQMKEHNIVPIDMVVVNLYAFGKVIQDTSVSLAEAIEHIDIGGPSMLRSAAKNYTDVAVLTDPENYRFILDELQKNNCSLPPHLLVTLAQKVFQKTAHYDAVIASYLSKKVQTVTPSFPETVLLNYEKQRDLRYGENPHQKAAFYTERSPQEISITTAKKIWGKELSFNNIIDFDGALETVKEFNEPTVAVIKHTNPCGVASSTAIEDAFRKAWATDPVSAFGSVIGCNMPISKELAKEISQYFVEGIIAPSFQEDALDILGQKKNIRLLSLEQWIPGKIDFDSSEFDLKKVVGGLLVQERDLLSVNEDDLTVMTEKHPSQEELKSLIFAWKVVKHVKSNAIVYARGTETIGIGAGQMSRVDSAQFGILKAQKEIKGSVLASDAFFPFRDSIDAAYKAGITAIIQPGGSIRDEEVIQACDEQAIAMVFTGKRHFRH
ncbi:bifunctional phosphoribosylaminoimidazolecarboxamide formyltransferase/IMP cyclohydrolase [Chlamydiota bacterium]